MKKQKKLLILLMALCIVFCQCSYVQAGTTAKKAKKAKYTVTLNKSVYTMKKGKKVTLKASLNKAAKKKGVQWTSSNKKVAVVSSKGKVTAKGKGKATITVKVKGTKVKATCKITVGTPVKKITLNKKDVSLTTGESFQLKTKITPAKPTSKKVTYASSNKKVATVTSKGVIKAVAAGTTKITVSAADGAGAKAVCKVTVKEKEVPVTAVSLNETSLSLKPGDKKTLVASITPENATNGNVTWTTSNAAVVKVGNDGSVEAVSEGTADITATAGGISATCGVKVAYDSQVSTPQALIQALSSKVVTDIVYSSDATESIEIPEGDYSTKTITFNAPNAEVVNKGRFSKVVINAIAQNTYHEQGNNVIYFNAPQGHIVVEQTGIAAINMQSVGQNLHVENEGNISDLNVVSQANLTIEGSNVVPVTIGSNAKDSYIKTSAELKITAASSWKMAVLPGGENTKASVDTQNCLPQITGIGCIPVVVSADNDLINIPAQWDSALGISQKVEVDGNVQEIRLETVNTSDDTEDSDDEDSEDTDETEISASTEPTENKKVVDGVSAGVSIYLIPYTTENQDMESNYAQYISGKAATTVTDENGYYAMPQTDIGNYWMVLTKEGYRTIVQSLVITSSNSEVYANASITMLSDEIAARDPADHISGKIVDGLTGNAVCAAGLKIKLRQGTGNITGNVLKETYTDEQGNYSLSDIAAGVYTLEVMDLRQNLSSTETRYNSANINIVVVPGYLETDNYNCVINPQMQTITGQGQVQFTLTWGTEESGASADIDSHLVGPRADGNGNFHVYFDNKSYWVNEETYADLDVDDTTYEGPEHTTIYKETPGIYHFYIHNFSESDTTNSDMMKKSSIQVRITIGSSSYVYNCPNQLGNLWYVCDYNSVTHTIIPKNTMSNFIGSVSDIGLSDEELNSRYLESAKNDAFSTLNEYQNKLMLFKDNDVRKGYLNQIESWRTQVSQATDYQAVNVLRQTIEDQADDMVQVTYPNLSVDDGYVDSFSSSLSYDDDDNVTGGYCIAYMETEYNTIKNFNAQAYEGQTVSFQELGEDSNYKYLVSVTMENGMQYDLYVAFVTGTAQTELMNRVTELKRSLSVFDVNDEITEMSSKLANIEKDILTVEDDEAYNTLNDKLSEISTTLSQKNEAFELENVNAEGLDDWYISYNSYTDDEEEAVSYRYVLTLERDEDVSNQDILGKLTLKFECGEDEEGEEIPSTVSYTITPLTDDEHDCVALIKATDSATGYVKNIYVRITEL